MLGASIYVVPFMIQRNVPGIGPYVLPAFLFAAIPAILAAFCYSILGSAMPRAGGSYVYASRGLQPYLGFVASFSQWFGLSIVIGVISYIIIPFFRDIAFQIGMNDIAELLENGLLRVALSLLLLWTFIAINIRGTKAYEQTLIPLMFVMFALGAIVIASGFYFNHEDFRAATGFEWETTDNGFDLRIFMTAGALLFSSFIGFDSIAQAGGEAKDPGKSLPKAIGLAISIVGLYYILFSAAVYHAVPWQYVASESINKDITAPGLMSTLLPPWLGALILTGAAIALINDLPAMLLSVSRLMFAWAEDGIFPKVVTKVHRKYHTPHTALLLSGGMATIGILGSHFAGDFFLGIDIMVTSMMVNFLLMCITVLTLPKRSPKIFDNIKVFTNLSHQQVLGYSGVIMITLFLIVHIVKDLRADLSAWYFHSTPIWLIVMSLASLLYLTMTRSLKNRGIQIRKLFSKLPPE